MTNSDSIKLKPAPPVFTVSQLNRLARQLLEDHFPSVIVEGEISNFSMPSSGHWYLTLKDQSAQVRCAMFRNRNMFVRFRPRDGMQVIIKAKLSLYEGRGDYQLLIEQLEETGTGALRREFELLKQKLLQEGLFETQHKLALPPLASHIAVVTSPTGAAIRDIISVFKRRFPAIRITVVPVAVQGQTSANELTNAVEMINRRKGHLVDVDVILLSRGGGSLEDLWSFNNEKLAYAIHASTIPVVSAVGHEIDFTIADFVADIRAATPSAAAELLSPDQKDYLEALQRQKSRLTQVIKNNLLKETRQLNALARLLRHPGRRLQEQTQRLDTLELRLRRSWARGIRVQQFNLTLLEGKLKQCSPQKHLASLEGLVISLQSRLQKGMTSKLTQINQQLNNSSHNLHAVSPLATLARGYSITRTDKGVLLRSYEETAPGVTIFTELNHGYLVSTVLESGTKPE